MTAVTPARLNGAMAEGELATLATSQEGLVTRIQARDHLSRGQLKSRLASGRLVPVRRGVYRFAGVPIGPTGELRAALLAAGPAAVASRRAAAVVWGVPGVLSEQPELTHPWPQWPRLPGVRSHQSTCLPVTHCTTRDGMPVTRVARTLTDLSSVFRPEQLGKLVDACLRRGLVELGELRTTHRDLTEHGRGRRGLSAIATVLEARPSGYQAGGSRAELDLLGVLLAAGLPRPCQQHQVVSGRTVYLLDYAYPGLRIGIEFDGWFGHGQRSDFDHAAARGNALELAGWTVLHFTTARERSLRAIGRPEAHLREFVGRV